MISPESLRALAANLGLVEVVLNEEGFDAHATCVQASSEAIYAAADEIERLKDKVELLLAEASFPITGDMDG